MPLYEYHCETCRNVFEKMVRFADADRKQECPHCQSENTIRRVSRIAVTGLSSDTGYSASSSCSSTGGRFT